MGLAGKVVGIIVVVFIIGSIGGTAFVMASNSTAYNGTSTAVSTVMVTLVPVMAGIGIALYMLPRRA